MNDPKAKGPPRYKTDPNLPFTAEEIAKLTDATSPPPSMAEAMADAAFGARQAEDTLVHCPACEGCVTCHGLHLVSATARREYRKAHPIERAIDLTESHLEDDDDQDGGLT